MKLYLVGSRARNAQHKSSDYDYVTSSSFVDILKKLPYKSKIKGGTKYIQLLGKDDKIIDIWRVTEDTLMNNVLLRSMDKEHYIGLVKEVIDLGYEMSFNGIKNKRTYINPIEFIKKHPQLEKYLKYLKNDIQYINI